MENLLTGKHTEGDINSSEGRTKWNESICDRETQNILENDARYFLHQSMSTPCLDVITGCNGSYIQTLSGKKILDFHGNNVHQSGYANEYIIGRILEQMQNLTFSPRRYTNRPAVELARKLADLLPGDLNRSLFCPGGTSAIGMAMKLARFVTGKYKLVSLWDSFHGASIDAISAGGEAIFRNHIGPLLPGTIHIPPPSKFGGVFGNTEEDQLKYADFLEYVVQKDGEVGAFLAETIRNTDVQIPSKAYWKRIREICDKYGIMLILDEIPIALGRTGKLFAFEHYDIEPDILCLGKGLGGAVFPFAAMVTRDKYNVAGSVSLGHYTYEKSPLGSVAALAVLNYIEQENLLQKVVNDGVWLQNELGLLQNEFPVIGDTRGIGLLWGIELFNDKQFRQKATREAEQIMYECLARGLSFKVSQGNVLQLSPPLTISRNELQSAISILREAFKCQLQKNFNQRLIK